MGLPNILLKSPDTPYSIYFGGTIRFRIQGGFQKDLRRVPVWAVLVARAIAFWGSNFEARGLRIDAVWWFPRSAEDLLSGKSLEEVLESLGVYIQTTI